MKIRIRKNRSYTIIDSNNTYLNYCKTQSTFLHLKPKPFVDIVSILILHLQIQYSRFYLIHCIKYKDMVKDTI
jgi:hypothetical protein